MDVRKHKRFNLFAYNQWPGLFESSNWYDFTLVKIKGEFCPYEGHVELEIGLIGVTLMLTYVYDFKFRDEMEDLAGSAIRLLEASEWTSVDDKEPPQREWVAMVCKSDTYSPGVIHRFWGDADMALVIQDWGITHWMIVPELPEC